jgi:hypothetical protein
MVCLPQRPRHPVVVRDFPDEPDRADREHEREYERDQYAAAIDPEGSVVAVGAVLHPRLVPARAGFPRWFAASPIRVADWIAAVQFREP